MRHHPSACRLAELLVKSQFGDFCQVVCKLLIDRGPQTLPQLVLAADFAHLREAEPKQRRQQSDRLVRTCLQVLIQHSYVVAHLVRPEGTRKNKAPEEYQVYVVDVAAITRSIRLPYYMKHASEWYSKTEDPQAGALHEAVVTVLLENGRLTLEQIAAAVADKRQLTEDGAADQIRDAFQALVMDRYVEQAPPCNLPLPPPPVFAKLTGRRPAAPKPGSEAQNKIDEDTERQRPAVDYRESRFQLPPEFSSTDAPVGEKRAAAVGLEKPPAKRQKQSKPTAKKVSGDLAVQPKLSSANGGGSPAAVGNGASKKVEQAPQLWRVSHMTFTRRLRHAACAAYLEEKHGDVAGVLARGILRSSKPSTGLEPRDERTCAAATEKQVAGAVAQAGVPKGCEMPEDLNEALEKSLEQTNAVSNTAFLRNAEVQGLVEDEPLLVHMSQTHGYPAYYVDLKKCIGAARMAELQGVLKRRYGVEGLRVWKCVLEHRQMESKTVSERVLMPFQETRELLYRLMKGGFIAIQDIPRTADHAPSKTIYTWKVDLEAVHQQLAANMMKAVCNLTSRIDAELAKRPLLMEAMQRRDAVAISSFGQEAQKVKLLGDQLECHILSLAPSIALFLEF